jgi:hypothetical protein
LDRRSAHRKVATYTQNNANTDIHTSGGIRTHESSVRAGEDGSWLRPLGYSDRQSLPLILKKYRFQKHLPSNCSFTKIKAADDKDQLWQLHLPDRIYCTFIQLVTTVHKSLSDTLSSSD